MKTAAMRRSGRPAGLAPFAAMLAAMGLLWGLCLCAGGSCARGGQGFLPFLPLGAWILLALALRLLLPREIPRWLGVFAKALAFWRDHRT